MDGLFRIIREEMDLCKRVRASLRCTATGYSAVPDGAFRSDRTGWAGATPPRRGRDQQFDRHRGDRRSRRQSESGK